MGKISTSIISTTSTSSVTKPQRPEWAKKRMLFFEHPLQK